MRNVKTAYGTMSAEKTTVNQYISHYKVTAPCGTYIGTVDVWSGVNNKKSYDPMPATNGGEFMTRKTLADACNCLASAFYSLQRAAQIAAEQAEIEAQEADQIAAETVAAEQAQAPTETIQFDHVTATKAGRFYDLTETQTGRALGSVETSFRGVFYAWGHAFGTLEKAAKFLAKQVLAAYHQIEHENGSALADLQAQTDHDIYCARAFEEELQREQATRQMYEQAPAYTPKKFVLGRADGTAKIVLDTGETRLIPAETCRICGGKSKKSTALVSDFINEPPSVVYTKDKLATRRAVCKKCQECGHSWIEGKQAENLPEN